MSLTASGMGSYAWFQPWSQITTSTSVLTYQIGLIRCLSCSHSAQNKRLFVFVATFSRGLCFAFKELGWSVSHSIYSGPPSFLAVNAEQSIAKSVNVCMAWRHELFKKLAPLNDLNVQTSCVINRCNILSAPSRYMFSRYADTLYQKLFHWPLHDFLCVCVCLCMRVWVYMCLT